MKNIKYPVWQEILFCMHTTDKNRLSEIQKDLKVTYSYLHKVAKNLKEIGFIFTIKKPGKKIIALTPKGLELAEAIKQLKNGSENV